MSNFLITVLKSSRVINCQRLVPFIGFHSSNVQHLYSSASLGIEGYLQGRKRMREQFTGHIDKFKTKMSDFVKDPKNMIFTEDLRNIVHLAEPTDLKLVTDMIKKFNTQTTEFRFGSFKFGPVVMRLFHFLDAPTEALQSFQDPANDGFYDQQTSYHILLDLLYKNQLYDDMFTVFEKIQQKQINMTRFPKYPVVLILAACYKQNTKESFEYAKKLWLDMVSAGVVPVRRATTLLAGLALKQGVPEIAMEVLTQQTQHYVTVRNLKALALADMGRIEDVVPVLRQVLDIDRPGQKDKHTFFQETITKVQEVVAKSKNEDVKIEIDKIIKALKERNLIDNQSLDKLLMSEITVVARKPDQRNYSGNQNRQWNSRPFGGGNRHNMV